MQNFGLPGIPHKMQNSAGADLRNLATRKEEEMKKRIIALDDTYTSDDIRSINALLFITSMIMFALALVAQLMGIL